MVPIQTICALLLLSCPVALVGATAEHVPVHACVVGAGIAGASASHFLSGLNGVRVSVFERSGAIGGRIATVPLGDGTSVEAGASIIASRNRLMDHFVTLLGLERRNPGSDEDCLGLWDGAQFRLRTSSYSIVTIFRMLLRYNISLFRMRTMVAELLDSFDKLYPPSLNVREWRASSNMKVMFEPTSTLYALSQTTFSKTVHGSLSPKFVEEMASAISRVNYNQEADDMNGLAGYVSLAGSGDDLWAVKGGNVQVVTGLLKRSGADIFLRADIEEVQKLESGYAVSARDGRTWNCDAVVIAAPIELSNMTLPAGMGQRADVGRKFQRTVATFVEGSLNAATFGPSEDPPDAILTTAYSEQVFSSVSRVHKFENGTMIFKVFSKETLDASAMAKIFSPGATVRAVYPWLAYPKFRPPEQFASFELDPDGAVYYTSPIESGGSAMEMSAISGANAAALIRDKFGLEAQSDANSRKDEL